jgi:histidinol-phosphate phosphatase family protein
MLDVDLTRFWTWHSCDESAVASLFLHPNDHPQDSDLVEIDAGHRILRFHPYPHPANAYLPNMVNAALYILRREALPQYDETGPALDFARDLFPGMLQSGARLRGYVSPEYIKDVGTPDRLDRVNRDFWMGIISHASLSVSKPAVFVDRDGTLNEDRGYIASPEDFRVFNFVGRALRRLNEAGWPTVIVTNQPVLARGEANYDDLRRIHGKLDAEMARFSAYFDRLYLCPHHPDSGFWGEVFELKIKCACRKPAPGLIFEAQRDLNLDLAESWLIGDSSADVGAAAAAGLTSILVQTGLDSVNAKHTCHPDFVAGNFATAVDFILDFYPLLARSCGPILELIESGSHWFVGGTSQFARRSLAATLRRELRKHGKPCGLIHLDTQALTTADLRACLEVHSKVVTLWEGESALNLARELGMLHRSVYAPDSAMLRDALPESRYLVMNAWLSDLGLVEASR